MSAKKNSELIVLPVYVAEHLGAPFKVMLIKSVKQIINQATGEPEQTIIPNLRGLLQQVVMSRILIPRKLSGKDVKFIRKALPLKANVLAEKIGVSPEHLSRCEAGERALSPGTEKCLRIAVLLELCRVPEPLRDLCEKDESLKRRLDVLTKAIQRIESIVNEMRIPAAHDPEEELCLAFRTAPRPDKSLFDEDIEADWLSDPEEAIAA